MGAAQRHVNCPPAAAAIRDAACGIVRGPGLDRRRVPEVRGCRGSKRSSKCGRQRDVLPTWPELRDLFGRLQRTNAANCQYKRSVRLPTQRTRIRTHARGPGRPARPPPATLRRKHHCPAAQRHPARTPLASRRPRQAASAQRSAVLRRHLQQRLRTPRGMLHLRPRPASHGLAAARPAGAVALPQRRWRPHLQPKRPVDLPRASALEGFTGFSSLMRPELAAIFSAVIAVGSVGLNLYGGLLTESRRVDLQREVRWLAGRLGLKGGPVAPPARGRLSPHAAPPAWPAAGGPREDVPGAAEGAAVHHRALQVRAPQQQQPC